MASKNTIEVDPGVISMIVGECVKQMLDNSYLKQLTEDAGRAIRLLSDRAAGYTAVPVGEANRASVEAQSVVKDAIREAGRQGDMAIRVQRVPGTGEMMCVYIKRSNTTTYLVRMFLESDEREVFFEFPENSRRQDDGHRLNLVRKAISRYNYGAPVFYEITQDGYLHLFRDADLREN